MAHAGICIMECCSKHKPLIRRNNKSQIIPILSPNVFRVMLLPETERNAEIPELNLMIYLLFQQLSELNSFPIHPLVGRSMGWDFYSDEWEWQLKHNSWRME